MLRSSPWNPFSSSPVWDVPGTDSITGLVSDFLSECSELLDGKTGTEFMAAGIFLFKSCFKIKFLPLCVRFLWTPAA